MMHKWGLWDETQNRVIRRSIKKPDTPTKEGKEWLPLTQDTLPPFDDQTEILQAKYTNNGKGLHISYSKFDILDKVSPTLYEKKIGI